MNSAQEPLIMNTRNLSPSLPSYLTESNYFEDSQSISNDSVIESSESVLFNIKSTRAHRKINKINLQSSSLTESENQIIQPSLTLATSQPAETTVTLKLTTLEYLLTKLPNSPLSINSKNTCKFLLDADTESFQTSSFSDSDDESNSFLSDQEETLESVSFISSSRLVIVDQPTSNLSTPLSTPKTAREEGEFSFTFPESSDLGVETVKLNFSDQNRNLENYSERNTADSVNLDRRKSKFTRYTPLKHLCHECSTRKHTASPTSYENANLVAPTYQVMHRSSKTGRSKKRKSQSFSDMICMNATVNVLDRIYSGVLNLWSLATS